MIARVTLEIALRKEFDYLIPPDLAGQVDVGSRVQVPFGARKVTGCVTAVAEESAHARLKPIIKVIGAQTLVTPKILKLARWIGGILLLPAGNCVEERAAGGGAQEQSGWRERLFVRALPVAGEFPKLPKRQREVWNIIEERREMPLQELLELAETTARRCGIWRTRDWWRLRRRFRSAIPTRHEHILPTTPLELNLQQVRALAKIKEAMDGRQDEKVKN